MDSGNSQAATTPTLESPAWSALSGDDVARELAADLTRGLTIVPFPGATKRNAVHFALGTDHFSLCTQLSDRTITVELRS